jgi:hypothetical protein
MHWTTATASGHLGYIAGAFGVAFALLAIELAVLARRASKVRQHR